ncbi:hypothetical protein KI387_020001, partial [Taxus chinensis]
LVANGTALGVRTLMMSLNGRLHDCDYTMSLSHMDSPTVSSAQSTYRRLQTGLDINRGPGPGHAAACALDKIFIGELLSVTRTCDPTWQQMFTLPQQMFSHSPQVTARAFKTAYRMPLQAMTTVPQAVDFVVMTSHTSSNSHFSRKACKDFKALPFTDALKLFSFMEEWISDGNKVELVCRIAMLLLQIHHQQLVSTPAARSVLTGLQGILRSRVKGCKDLLGFNLAAMDHFK